MKHLRFPIGEQKEKSGRRRLMCLTVLFLIAAAAAGTVYLRESLGKAQQQKNYEELAGQASGADVSAVGEPDGGDAAGALLGQKDGEADTAGQELSEEEQNLQKLEEMGVPIPEKSVDFETLQSQTNSDIYAWIYIPDSMIDYPILQHPTDNLYYLQYNIDGSKGYPGCIYTENYNSKDFTDPVTVIYGHNMKNGSMFAGLHKFEDSEYFEEHPYVYVYTREKLLVYEIFAACMYSNEHILLNHDFTDKVSFDYYLSEIAGVREMGTNRREDLEVTADDRIIVLSTCVANKSDKRYLVQGVLLNED